LKAAYKRVDPELRTLEEENERLKRIVARQALELEVKTEPLKKNSYPTQEKITLAKRYFDRATVRVLTSWM
jgi:hypothetical protein